MVEGIINLLAEAPIVDEEEVLETNNNNAMKRDTRSIRLTIAPTNLTGIVEDTVEGGITDETSLQITDLVAVDIAGDQTGLIKAVKDGTLPVAMTTSIRTGEVEIITHIEVHLAIKDDSRGLEAIIDLRNLLEDSDETHSRIQILRPSANQCPSCQWG